MSFDTRALDPAAAERTGTGADSRLMAMVLRQSGSASRLGAWLLPAAAAAIMLGIIVAMQPDVISYSGLTLLLSASFPLILASLAQMFVIAGGDVDLSIGSFVSLVNVIFAAVVGPHVLLGALFLIGLVVASAAVGALITIRRLPSIIVTLGVSFIWLGIAIIIMPTPGGTVPAPIVSFTNLSPPVIPGIIVGIIFVTAVTSWLLFRTRYGAVLRGVGSNPESVSRAGWSVLKAKVALYGLAGVFGVLSGLVLSGQSTSGDPNIAQSYVLLTIAAVIVGGGSFSGGDVSAAGTVAGALVMGLIAELLQFLNVSSNYQIGAQGLLLVIILVLRAAAIYLGRRRTAGAAR